MLPTESGNSEAQQKQLSLLAKAGPWMAGVGFMLGHVATASNCTIPQQGRCSSCGGCVVALGSLVAWAMLKKHRDGDEFYIQK